MRRTTLVIGGSKGIGNAIINCLSSTDHIVNLSRTRGNLMPEAVNDFRLDIAKDDFPELDKLDSLIYCPGSINLKPITSLKLDDFKSDFEINVLGAVRAIKAYLPLLKKSDNASIILFSTVATKLGMPFHASVAASKSGVEGLAKSLAAELAPTIRVNCIAPTVTDTLLASRLLRNEKARENISERHPLKNIIDPNEIASLVTFLISDSAKNITGQVIPVDSGIVSVKL